MSVRPVAVVTGATGGIGRAICRRLGSMGYVVVAHGGRSQERANNLSLELSKGGIAHHIVVADLAQMSGVDHLTQAIDVLLETEPNYEYRALVNNAAKLLGPAFGQTNARAFDDYFAINTRAPFFLGQHASEHLQEGGCIVNISSASAHISSPGDIVYAMSKASIESFTANAAEALARKGIRINNVVPGFTDNGNHAFKDPRVLEYMSTFSALGDVARPSVVAEAVSFLISDAASRTTGATLDVSGGMLLGLRGHREGSVKALLTEQ